MTFKRIRTYGREIRNYPGIQQMNVPLQKFVEGRLNQGMISIVDPADLPTGALVDAVNCVSRYDRLQRRNGTTQFSVDNGATTVPVPDNNRVLAVKDIKLQDGTKYIVRFTAPSTFTTTSPSVATPPSPQLQPIPIPSVYILGVNNWIPCTGPALHGLQTDRFQAIAIWNGQSQDIVFSNNGADPIQALDPHATPTPSYAPLSVSTGISTNFRYITGFYNRVVGAAIAGQNEVLVGWSGDTNPTVWDPNVDETAGSAPIQDTPADLSDNITGLFSFTNTMILLRERSIWLANPQPIPTDPFNFYAVIPGIGCNCPYSAQVIDDGIAFLDQRKKTVYYFVPGGGIQPIGRPIETVILNGVDNLSDIFSSYDPTNNDYTICVPQSSSVLVRTFTYNFRTQGWTRSEYNFNPKQIVQSTNPSGGNVFALAPRGAFASTGSYISSADDIEVVSGGLEILELSGTIGSLQGTISSLARDTSAFSTRVYGRSDGGIMIDTPLAPNDNMTNIPAGDGDVFTTTFVSKDFMLPVTDAYFAQIKLEYIESVGGSGTLYYNKQTGAMPLSDPSWVIAKQVSTTLFNSPQLITFTQQIKSRRLSWRLDINAGAFAIVGYEVHNYPSGLQRPTGT